MPAPLSRGSKRSPTSSFTAAYAPRLRAVALRRHVDDDRDLGLDPVGRGRGAPGTEIGLGGEHRGHVESRPARAPERRCERRAPGAVVEVGGAPEVAQTRGPILQGGDVAELEARPARAVFGRASHGGPSRSGGALAGPALERKRV